MESKSFLNLETSLLNIMEQLTSKKIDGCLIVKTSTKTGEIYFKDGEVTHSTDHKASGETALKNILGWNGIQFEFDQTKETFSKSILRTSKYLLQDCRRRSDEWVEIKKIITDFNNCYVISNENVSHDIKLQPEEWQIISFLDGNRTVAEIIEQVNRDDFTVCQIIYKLYINNLIKKIEYPSSVIVEPAFFDLLEKELVRHLGPVAIVILNDEIAKFKFKRTRFPIFKVSPLIEKLSLEIENLNHRSEFLKKMIESFHKI
ncbi:DUF4388 domain-containing protein [candidate division KSB1 bacterium]|nr:DUF4388 domain-containing protein [candidate division KSB1 bacterium]